MKNSALYMQKNAAVRKSPETIKNGLDLIIETQAKGLKLMTQIAENYKTVACIGYTHYQVAQPVTYGKRVALWIQHLLPAFELLEKNIQAITVKKMRQVLKIGKDFAFISGN